MAKVTRIKTKRTEGKMESFLQAKRKHLKEELDRIYYTLPYDSLAPIVTELKDTIDCLNEMGETHNSFSTERGRNLRRKAL